MRRAGQWATRTCERRRLVSMAHHLPRRWRHISRQCALPYGHVQAIARVTWSESTFRESDSYLMLPRCQTGAFVFRHRTRSRSKRRWRLRSLVRVERADGAVARREVQSERGVAASALAGSWPCASKALEVIVGRRVRLATGPVAGPARQIWPGRGGAPCPRTSHPEWFAPVET